MFPVVSMEGLIEMDLFGRLTATGAKAGTSVPLLQPLRAGVWSPASSSPHPDVLVSCPGTGCDAAGCCGAVGTKPLPCQLRARGLWSTIVAPASLQGEGMALQACSKRSWCKVWREDPHQVVATALSPAIPPCEVLGRLLRWRMLLLFRFCSGSFCQMPPCHRTFSPCKAAVGVELAVRKSPLSQSSRPACRN